MIVTVTPNPALDKIYWVEELSHDPEAPLTRATRSMACAGGKGINVSIFLARMGMESVAMGFIAGHTGRVIENKVREEGITTNFVWTDGETRTNAIILEKGKEASPTEVNEAGPLISKIALEQFMRRYCRIIKRAKYVVLGGSLPPGVDSNFYKELILLAKKHNVKAIANVGGAALTEAIEAAPFLVKPDIRERKEIGGVMIDSLDTLLKVGKEILSAGVEVVIVSHEITRDALITKEGIWDLEAQDVRFVNIVGAEDALIGGLLYKLYQGAPIEEAAGFGMAAATACAEIPEEVSIDRAAVELALNRIKMVRLE